MPNSVSLISIRFKGVVSANSCSLSSRASTSICLSLPKLGSITYLGTSLTHSPICGAIFPCWTTTPFACEIRVVVRSISGVSNCSEISKPARTIS